MLENDLLIRFALCLDPSDPACAGIVEKGMRAIDPQYAKNPKDKKFRQAKRQRILRELWVGQEIPHRHTYPNFGLHKYTSIQEQVAVPIDGEAVRCLAEKIVRGIFYMQENLFIEPPYKIESFVLTDQDAEPVIAAIDRFGISYSQEPGISVRRAVLPEDGISSIFVAEIWKRFKIYASVVKVPAK